MEEVTDEPLYRNRVCGTGIGKAGPAGDPGACRGQPGAAGGRDPQLRHYQAGGAGAGGLAALLAGARGGDGGNQRLLEGPVLPAGGRGVRVRAGRRQAGQEPAGTAQEGSGRLALAGGVLRARGGHRVLRGRAGVPDHPAAHPVPAGPDRGADPGEAKGAEKLLESAAIKISAVLTDLHGVTGRDIMDRLIAGQRNPKALAQLARTAARRKISQLEEALEGA